MNAERLLDAFNRIGDEPDMVQQFRKLVVALAMSGRLVAPDETAPAPSNLLKQIEAKKRALVHKRVLRKQIPLSTVSLDDLPKGFSDPSSFVRLGEIARIEKGQTGIMKAEPGAYPLVVTAEERGTCVHFDFDGSAAIVPLVSSAGHGKASLQRLHYQEGKFALGSILAAIFPHAPELISARFLFEYLTSFKDELLVSQMIGTANVTLSVVKLSEVPVPLVPPLVQGKVDELMGLCDRLEEARTGREGVRDRLAAAILSRLNALEPETLQADARFALDALPALTTRPDQIKRLRQTILNLAVRGKLVDGTTAKAASVGDYRTLQNGYAFKSSWFSNEGVRLLRNANIGHGEIRWNDVVHLPEDRLSEFERFQLHEGDIVLTLDRPFIMTGTKVARISAGDLPSLLLQRVGRFVETSKGLNDDYLFLWISSPHFNDQIDPGRSNGVPHISSKQVEAAEIFVPPLAEQHRIVAKVEALLALCDRLEASLTATAATRRRLLDALLVEALAPTDARQLEAAE